MKIRTNEIALFCSNCDKESSVSWLSMFDRLVGRRKPRFCPWCGEELTTEEESIARDASSEAP